ncbi:Hypothetical predicted protein, partial [Pelobates cultripes]
PCATVPLSNADNFTEVENMMVALLTSINTVSVRLEKLENPQTPMPSPVMDLPTPSPSNGNPIFFDPTPGSSTHIITPEHLLPLTVRKDILE